MRDIPIVYEIILQKFRARGIADRIETQTARNILAIFFHFPREKRSAILQEMYELDLIRLSNSKFIEFTDKAKSIEIAN